MTPAVLSPTKGKREPAHDSDANRGLIIAVRGSEDMAESQCESTIPAVEILVGLTLKPTGLFSRPTAGGNPPASSIHAIGRHAGHHRGPVGARLAGVAPPKGRATAGIWKHWDAADLTVGVRAARRSPTVSR
jgi:hypothetical protein